MPTLRHRLQSYDGKNVALLRAIAEEFRGLNDYDQELVDLICADDALVIEGSTWLLKAHLETGGQLSPELTQRLLAAAPNLQSWQSQLHLTQSLQFLNIPADQAEPLALWLGDQLQHKRPFLRAWALDGMAVIASQHADFRRAAHYALGEAHLDEAASVRARARAVAKKMS